MSDTSVSAARLMQDDFLAGLAADSPPSAAIRQDQMEARAAFSITFGLAASLAALVISWAAMGTLRISIIAAWVPLVCAANWLSCRRARNAAFYRRTRQRWLLVTDAAEGLVLALLWASAPAYALFLGGGTLQPAIGAVIGSMLIAGIALAPVPAAGLAWVATLALAFVGSVAGGGNRLNPFIGVSLLGGAVLAGLAIWRIGRWTAGLSGEIATARGQSEAVALLLREYEHRGVGWLWQVDAENRVLYISRRMMSLLGRSPGQVIGHSLPGVLGGSGALGETLLARAPFSALEMEIRTIQGTRWISLSGDPVIAEDGAFNGFRGVGADVTEVRRTQERLTNLANMDVLSGLPNRGRVRELLGEALENAQKTNVPCAILFLDLDNFKPVNDTFGHVKGDAVLKAVTQRLVREVGDMGAVGRIGGDEFAVVVRDAQSRVKVEALGARLIAAIADPFEVDNSKVKIGLSIGCAFGPIDGKTVDDLIQRADMALYQAKAQGRGICCSFNPGMQSEAEHRMRLEHDLQHALAGNQFRLTYQPLVRASDQRLVGFEALIRWHHPTRGMISPLDFIPLAEETGLINHLGDWVIEEACRAASHWPDNISVAVNLSPRQLVLPALPNAVSESLTRHRIKANRLELEVTESVFLGATEGALDVLKRLRQLGVGIALDDFGTGYSSLGYLNKAVFHKLKIDGSFVRESAKNKETVAIIQSIVALAQSFRMTITAEGVETTEDFNRMRDLGCHQIQGYLFGRPLDFEKATELVRGGANARMSA